MDTRTINLVIELSPDMGRITLYDNLITRLKSETGLDGITSQFDSLDVLCLLANYNQTSSLHNIIQDAYHPTIMTDVAGAFVKDKGYKGIGAFKMDSNFNPFDGGTYKFKTDDNTFGCYLNSNVREVKGLISNLDSLQNGYELKTHPNGCTCINGNTVSTSVNAVDCTGGFASKRFPSGMNGPYKNAKPNPILNNNSVTSTVNKTFKLFCRDIGGVYSLNSLNRMSFYYFGNSNIDIKKLERAVIEEYLKPIGAALTKRVVFDGNSFFSQLTMPTKVMDLLWANGVECTSLFNGVFGTPITTMISNAGVNIDAYQETYFDKEVLIMWELTNSMKGASANVNTIFTNLQTYFDDRHIAGWTCPMIMNTCPPFDSLNTSIGIYPSKRDNESDLFDVTKINGKIRSGLSTLGIDDCFDMGSGSPLDYDPIYKDSLGVSGVGEKNTTFFMADGHMTTVGYNNWATNHIYPIIVPLLS